MMRTTLPFLGMALLLCLAPSYIEARFLEDLQNDVIDKQSVAAVRDAAGEDDLMTRLSEFYKKSKDPRGHDGKCFDILNPNVCKKQKKDNAVCEDETTAKFCRKTCGCSKPTVEKPANDFVPDSNILKKLKEIASKQAGDHNEQSTKRSMHKSPPIQMSKRGDDLPADEENAMQEIADVNIAADLDLYESDIMMAPDKEEDDSGLSDAQKMSKRNALRDKAYLWPHRKVPYKIEASIGNFGVFYDAIKNAIAEIEAKTCVRFVERTTEVNYLSIRKLSGCWSYVGRVYYLAQPQNMSIGSGCEYKGTAVHELFHAIGFSHEQSRSDRDRYVEVMWDNVVEGMERNFAKHTSESTSNYVNYDFGSIMHYGSHYFSKNGQPTLKAIGASSAVKFGQRLGMSVLDATEVNALYHCADASATASGWSEWSEYSPCTSACYKRRQRFCTGTSNGNDCNGADSYGIVNEYVVCTPTECNAPKNGGWGKWGSWSACSVTCEEGTRNRQRSCTDPAPANGGTACAGSDKESGKCILGSCTAGPYDTTFDTVAWSNTWKLQFSNNMGWVHRSGSTSSGHTGPSGDHTSGKESYVYYEASSPAVQGSYSALYSTTLKGNGGKRCLSFWYHMYGTGIGSLVVFTAPPDKQVMSIVGDQGNVWKQATATIDAETDLQIVFYAVRGSSYMGDIAIDDIQITEAACAGSG